MFWQNKYLKEALAKNQIADKHICLRWWSLGQWMNGFRRGDEMHVCIAPLSKLLEPKQEQLLYVIQRGAIHEVLRVQISADFRSSAWIARDMHSQRWLMYIGIYWSSKSLNSVNVNVRVPILIGIANTSTFYSANLNF